MVVFRQMSNGDHSSDSGAGLSGCRGSVVASHRCAIRIAKTAKNLCQMLTLASAILSNVFSAKKG
jgi:hypothetical protein